MKLFIVVMGLLAGMFMCGILAYTGYDRITDGMENFLCLSSKLFDNTLNGMPEEHFLGTMPFTASLWEIDKLLEDDSNFTRGLGLIVNRTAEIDAAVTTVHATMKLFVDTLTEPANMVPKPASGEDLLHDCQLCSYLAEVAGPMLEVFEEEVSHSLASMRLELERQLEGSFRHDYQLLLRTSAEAMVELKSTIRDVSSMVLEGEVLTTARQMLPPRHGVTPLRFAAVGVILLALFIGFCGWTSTMCCIFREGKKGFYLPAFEFDNLPSNPYSRSVHRCALAAWCSGWWYATLAFVLGGVALIIVVPLSSGCLILDSLDGQLLREIRPALGHAASVEPEVLDLVAGLVDGCIANNGSSSSNLLDLLHTELDGQRLTLRELIEEQTKGPLLAHLDELSTELATRMAQGGSTSMQGVSELGVIGSVPVEATIIGNITRLGAAPDYEQLLLDDRGFPDGLQAAAVTSLLCSDHNVSLPGLNQTLLGLRSFARRMERFGEEVSGGGLPCARHVSCTVQAQRLTAFNAHVSPTTQLYLNMLAASGQPQQCQGALLAHPDCGVCQAGNAYLELKSQLRNLSTFRCDLFEDPADPGHLPCDPLALNATWRPRNGSWGCGRMLENGSLVLTRRPTACNLSEFSAYVAHWEPRLVRAVGLLDQTMSEVVAEMNASLRSLIQDSIFVRIDEIINGSDCGFLASHRRELVWSLCFQSVWGLQEVGSSYAICALLSLVMVLFMYVVWRCSLDNVNAWNPPPKSRE